MKLCLYTVNAFMDDTGEAWPAQASIAKAASLTPNTVQRILGEAIDLGWLGVEPRMAQGKAWKRYVSRAAIPDGHHSLLVGMDEKICKAVDHHLATYGPILKGGRPLKQKVKRTSVTAKVPTLKCEAPLLNTDGPHSDEVKVPLLKSKVPPEKGTKYPSEVSILSSNSKDQYEGAALPRSTTRVESLKPNGTEEAKKETPEARASRIRQAIAALPKDGDSDIAKIAHVTLDEVQQVRRQA
jgi:hypothetical protein